MKPLNFFSHVEVGLYPMARGVNAPRPFPWPGMQLTGGRRQTLPTVKVSRKPIRQAK